MPGITTLDKYFPQNGFNDIFSDIVNCDFEVRPSKTGFKHQLFAFRKRNGIKTLKDSSGNSVRQLDGDVEGALYDASKIKIYSDQGTLYDFDGTDLTQIIAGLVFSETDYSEEASKLSYIGGGRYPDVSTAYTVTAYNNATGEVTVSGGSIDDNHIGKYVYVYSIGGSNLSQRQVRFIESRNGSTKFTVDTIFDIDLNVNDVIHLYNELTTQYWFRQLRESGSEDNLYARDNQSNDMYWYFPNTRKGLIRDNRLAQLHKNRQTILFSDSRSYEIIDITKTVPLGNTQALNIASYSGYLFVFFEDTVGIIKKQIIDAASGDFLYLYQDLLNFGLFSERSYFIQGNDLYIFANDRQLYAVNLTVSSSGEVIADPQPQAETLTAFFQKISTGEVSFNYNLGTLRMVHSDTDVTNVYKYNRAYQGWMRDVYTQDDNFMLFFNSIDISQYTCFEDIIYEVGDLKDIDENITQKIEFYGPVQSIMDMFTITKLKLRIGFGGDGIGGTVACNVGGYRQYQKIGDMEDLEIIDTINSYVLGGGTIGGFIIGDSLMVGLPGFGTLEDYISEYIDISMNIRASGTYFKTTIENDTEKQLYFCGAVPIYMVQSPNMSYNKGVF